MHPSNHPTVFHLRHSKTNETALSRFHSYLSTLQSCKLVTGVPSTCLSSRPFNLRLNTWATISEWSDALNLGGRFAIISSHWGLQVSESRRRFDLSHNADLDLVQAEATWPGVSHAEQTCLRRHSFPVLSLTLQPVGRLNPWQIWVAMVFTSTFEEDEVEGLDTCLLGEPVAFLARAFWVELLRCSVWSSVSTWNHCSGAAFWCFWKYATK